MHKLLLSALILLLASVAFAADATPAKAPLPVTLPREIAVDYTLLQDGSLWSHTYTIETFDPGTGYFTGTGYSLTEAGITEIITGNVVGNLVTFHVLYTGGNPGYMVDAMGTLDDGYLTGVAISIGQNFTWTGTASPQ